MRPMVAVTSTLLFLLLSCTATTPNPAVTTPAPSTVLAHDPLAADAVAGVSDKALLAILDEHFDWELRTNPTMATRLGDHRFGMETRIAWPGQALADKVGQMEILRLRQNAKDTLGAKFGLKGFHDAVLSGGAVSLPVLRQQIETWIAARR